MVARGALTKISVSFRRWCCAFLGIASTEPFPDPLVARHFAPRSPLAFASAFLPRPAARAFAMFGAVRAASRRLAGLRPARSPHAFVTVSPYASAPTPFAYQELFELAEPKDIPWRKITSDHVSVHEVMGRRVLKVEPEALRLVAQEGMTDIAHLLRPGHLQQLANILEDPEASRKDRFVALELIKNANVAAGMVLPGCQDTGTAIIMGKKGQRVWTDGNDEEMLSRGVYDTYVKRNLRYSQVAPQTMFEEKNTGSNLPAQIDIYAKDGEEYHFHMMVRDVSTVLFPECFPSARVVRDFGRFFVSAPRAVHSRREARTHASDRVSPSPQTASLPRLRPRLSNSHARSERRRKAAVPRIRRFCTRRPRRF